jgi:hypothetical protein
VVGYAVGAYLADDRAEGGVGGVEMEEGFFHGNGRTARRIQ